MFHKFAICVTAAICWQKSDPTLMTVMANQPELSGGYKQQTDVQRTIFRLCLLETPAWKLNAERILFDCIRGVIGQ